MSRVVIPSLIVLPTAMQLPASEHETLAKTLSAPVVGLGMGVTDQVVPSQRSANGTEPLMPETSPTA